MSELPEVGARNSSPTAAFSLTHAAISSPRVRLRIYTNRAVATPSVTYGGVAMTCTDGRHRAPAVEHHYEIHNPPSGVQVVSGTFSAPVFYEVRLFDDAWLESGKWLKPS